MTGLDTNVLVRYLAKDDRVQFGKSRTLIESFTNEHPGFISVVSLIETIWVMESNYEATRAEVADFVANLLNVNSMLVESAASVRQALRLFSIGKADFADCLISQLGVAQGVRETVTFDKKAARDAGMRYLL